MRKRILKKILNYTDFFKLLGNEEPLCFVNNVNPIHIEDIEKYNGKADLYFIPNIGGRKNKDIVKFKTFFIDLDCGRTAENKYFPLDYVKRYKETQLKKLQSFKIKPNAVVETRNGYHIYWFIKENINYETWYSIENFLVEYFNADKKVKSPANQLRIPGTYWIKNNIEQPVFCKIVELNNFITYIETYFDLFDIKKQQKTTSKTQDIKFNQKNIIVPPPKNTFTSYKDIFDYLTKSVNMTEYLGEHYGLKCSSSGSFCCLIHKENTPSASIFKTDTGIQLYYCHSDRCGFKGNIIQVVSKLENCSRTAAIRKICTDLNIKYEKNQEIVELIFDNLQTLKDDIKYSHSDLYGVIYRYLPTLRALHLTALDNLLYANNGTEFIFSASTQYIATELGRKDKKNTGTDISLLCLLKMVEKLDLNADNIPNSYKAYIRRYQEEKAVNRYINIYTLPLYTYDKLSECNEMAKEVKRKNLRKKYFTYESVSNAFGRETADRVFPQIKNKPVKEIDKYLLNTIEYLLEKQGYFTVYTVRHYYIDNEVFFNEKQFIKQLPAIIQMLDLEKVKASKKLKEQFNIITAGYPNLYIKKQGD